MRRSLCLAATLLGLAYFSCSPLSAQSTRSGPSAGGNSRKLVLVELFTSQGCNMCPAAEELLAQLTKEYDRVVPIAFHVDYFDKPWKDPFSSPSFSGRQWQYSTLYNKENKVGKEDYLYFTPMMMVDGRYPMLGSDRKKAEQAIRMAQSAAPGVRLVPTLKDGVDALHKTLEVELANPLPSVAGKEVLVAVAVYENPVTTKVESGENGGKTLVENFAARKLDVKPVRVERTRSVQVSFPVELKSDWKPERCGLVVYVQEETSGRILQVAEVPWPKQPAATTASAAATP